MARTSWSEGENKYLREMLAKKLSSGQMAKSLNRGRGSIIRHIRILGLSLVPPKRRPPGAKTHHKTTALVMPAGEVAAPHPNKQHRQRPVLLDQPPLTACGIFALKDSGACKWPYDAEGGYLFCNTPTSLIYCPVHQCAAFQPVRYRNVRR